MIATVNSHKSNFAIKKNYSQLAVFPFTTINHVRAIGVGHILVYNDISIRLKNKPCTQSRVWKTGREKNGSSENM